MYMSSSIAFSSVPSRKAQESKDVQLEIEAQKSEENSMKVMEEKYQIFVKNHLSQVLRAEEFGEPVEKLCYWIHDLRDRECKEIKDILENLNLSSLLLHSDIVDNRILRLTRQLSELQMNMPAWDHIECIVRTALLTDMDPSGVDTIAGIDRSAVEKIQTEFVRDNVKAMLDKLYEEIKKREQECQEQTGETSDPDFKTWIRTLYGKTVGGKYIVYIVGPMGERPIHVCGFAIAKYRGSGKNHIAEGILDGIKAYVEDKPGNATVLFEPYGKDYCAAVRHCKQNAGNGMNLEALPYFDQINMWRERHKNMVTKDIGIFEGETIHFALIACGDAEAVKWFVHRDDMIKKNESIADDGFEASQQRFGCSSEKLEFSSYDYSFSLRLTDIKAKGFFFRPMYNEQLTSSALCELWTWYRTGGGEETNLHSSNPTSYFGFDLLSFAACQGNIAIFDLLFKSLSDRIRLQLEVWKGPGINTDENCSLALSLLKNRISQGLEQGAKNPTMSIKFLREIRETACKKKKSEKEEFAHDLAAMIVRETVATYQKQPFLQDDFVRQVIVNRKDEFGNTMLHLAAWNSKRDMFDHLVNLGADLWAENDDGLTPFTLSVRFGRWKIFKHIWERHFTKPYWRFGNVEADVVDYSQFESDTSGLGSVLSSRELARHVDVLILLKIANEVGEEESNLKSPAVVHSKLRAWCEQILSNLVIHEIFEKKNQDLTDSSEKKTESTQSPAQEKKRIQKPSPHFKSATELITMFRPAGWYQHTKELMRKLVLRKWSNGYYLVHFADTVLPYGLILLLFGLMWWQRKLHVLEHNFWWTSSTVVAPTPRNGIESACGWKAIRDSHSGRLQATLIIYGVPSLLRLAWVQSRLRPTDLDEDLNWKMSKDEIINFIFMNLESMFHIIAAGLFITIGSARVTSQTTGDIYQCSVTSVRTEKNATSIAALVLFFNLFIVCKPYQGLGVLVQTMYRFLLKDVFNFLVMYGMLFLAFLLALQTLHNANVEYLTWMDTSTEILPQVERAQNLSYLANNNIPEYASVLLATETALQGCLSKGKNITDTAFTLLEISFGDGLADAIEQARTKPFQCAGFTPDFLIGGLLIFWMFVTNVLFLNMLVAMMNKTFDDEMDSIESKMLLDMSYRILRYERNFPELVDRIEGLDQGKSFLSFQYWKSLVDDLILVVYCIPEIHFFAYISMYVYPQIQHNKREGTSFFWSMVRNSIKAASTSEESRNKCFSPLAYKQNFYENLSGSSNGLIGLVKNANWRFDPERDVNQYTSSQEMNLNHRNCLDGLICRVDSLRAALNKARVRVNQTGSDRVLEERAQESKS